MCRVFLKVQFNLEVLDIGNSKIKAALKRMDQSVDDESGQVTFLRISVLRFYVSWFDARISVLRYYVSCFDVMLKVCCDNAPAMGQTQQTQPKGLCHVVYSSSNTIFQGWCLLLHFQPGSVIEGRAHVGNKNAWGSGYFLTVQEKRKSYPSADVLAVKRVVTSPLNEASDTASTERNTLVKTQSLYQCWSKTFKYLEKLAVLQCQYLGYQQLEFQKVLRYLRKRYL